jgi:uncharacterized protein
MLLVKTKLNNDAYGGIGLYSAQVIAKDAIVWQYDPRFTITLTKNEVDSFSTLYQNWVNKFAYNFCDADNDDVYLDIDDSRFMNHSTQPSTYYDAVARAYRASHRIMIGEELTIDYRDFCETIDF